MSVDISKIRPGDKVTVELTVADTTASSVQVAGYGWFYTPCIIGHTPAPRPIKVGDTVIQCGFSAMSWRVLGIDDDTAWIKGPNGHRKAHPLNDLEHVDEA